MFAVLPAFKLQMDQQRMFKQTSIIPLQLAGLCWIRTHPQES